MVVVDGVRPWQGGSVVLRGRDSRRCRWQDGLPERWKDCVVVPAFFWHHRDYEIQAERIVGYEDEDQPCYCEYRIDFERAKASGPAPAAEVPQYWEHVSAWRLRDGHWLMLKRLYFGATPAQEQAFFCLSAGMPR